MDRLVDLDELILRCRTERARSYLAESIESYRAGAYRAAIVTAWIAVVFDIIEKLRELATAGDAQARTEIEQFDRVHEKLNNQDKQAIARALSFEYFILDIAKDKFQLIDGQQYTDLNRLREDRNRCAHPSFQQFGTPYQPTAELVRMHIRNAASHLLVNPPIQGKFALDELKRLVASEYFPTTLEKAKTALQESSFSFPTEPLVRGFVDMLIFSFFAKADALRFQKRTLVAMRAALELQRGIAEPRLCEQVAKLVFKVDDADIMGIVAVLGEMPECWAGLTKSHHDRIAEFILRGPAEQVRRTVPYAWRIPALNQSLIKRIAEFTGDELAALIASQSTGESSAPKTLIEVITARAVDIYTSAKNWTVANAEVERLILPLLDKMDAQHIEQIIRAPRVKGADLRGSHGFYTLLIKIAQNNSPIPVAQLLTLLREEGLNYYSDAINADLSGKIDEDIPF